MKKLMLAAATAAVAGGAFAAPLVYDYKASAKQMNLKEVNCRFGGNTFRVYQKYLSTASLTGYLVVDADGATSQTIIADKIANDPQFNTGAWLNGTPATTASDFGRNRAFLVVQNRKADRSIRFPKIIPAVLDAKWFDTRFRVDNGALRIPANTGIAEGYLYAGGDFGGATRTQLDLLFAGVTERGAVLPQVRMIGDYAWSSLWLFGKYNMPLGLVGLFDGTQAAIDANLPLSNTFAAGKFFFHDTWMNGSGFGKYTQAAAGQTCCGYPAGATAVVLQNLSGNLKGGLFLCTENGTHFTSGAYQHYVNALVPNVWEDQFFCERLVAGGSFGDAEAQTDLWQDGELEMNTTDCITGTWSIKLRTGNIAVAITRDDLNTGLGLAVPANWTEDAPGLTDLLSTIKGAATRLNSNVVFANGRNIYDVTGTELAGLDHSRVPFMSPAFAAYYGFLNFK